MNPRPLEPLDPVTKQPRRIPWGRWLLYACGVFVVLGAAVALAIRSYMTISVAPDTTVLTAPLLADGYPDYIGYLDAQNAVGVKPEENAWIAILRCCGPDDVDRELRAEHYRKLEMEPIPDEGLYFRPFYDTSLIKSFPEPVIVAASVAAQLPWHTRFVRLAAINSYRGAYQSDFLTFEDLPSDERTPAEIIEQTPAAAASAAGDLAEAAADPSDSEFSDTGESSHGYDNDEEWDIQDLRPAALAKLKPASLDPGEEAAWRREVFDTAIRKMVDRETTITWERAWTRDECPLTAYWLDCYAPHLDTLQAELRKRKKFYYPFIQESGKSSVIGAALLPVSKWRSLGLSYVTRANLQLGEKDYKAALQDFTSLIQIGNLHQQHPMILELLVGVAIDGFAYSTIRALVLDPQTTDAELILIDQILRDHQPTFDLADALDHGERLTYVGESVAINARNANPFFEWRVKKNEQQWERKIVNWDAVLRELNARYDRYRDAVKTQNIQLIRQTEAACAALPTNRKELEAWYDNPPWYLLPSQKTEVMKMKYGDICLPPLRQYYAVLLKRQVRRDLARVFVALERFHRANHAYPAALTELVPTYLPDVPLDPFGGQPIKYQRTPAGGYRAYSVWQNGIDDGGIPNVREDEDSTDYLNNDLVIGSADEIPPRLNFAW